MKFARLLAACERLAFGTTDKAQPSALSRLPLTLEPRELLLPASSINKFSEVWCCDARVPPPSLFDPQLTVRTHVYSHATN